MLTDAECVRTIQDHSEVREVEPYSERLPLVCFIYFLLFNGCLGHSNAFILDLVSLRWYLRGPAQ